MDGGFRRAKSDGSILASRLSRIACYPEWCALRGAEKRGSFGRRYGTTEVETLHLWTALTFQMRTLLASLDTFSDAGNAQSLPQAKNVLYHCICGSLRTDIADKGAINLQPV